MPLTAVHALDSSDMSEASAGQRQTAMTCWAKVCQGALLKSEPQNGSQAGTIGNAEKP